MDIIKIVISIVACISTVSANAQSNRIRDVRVPFESECPKTPFRTSDFPPEPNEKNLSKYFSKRLNWMALEKIGGVISLGVLIDSTGKPCLQSVSNNTINTPRQLLELDLGTIVNNMPVWKPGMDNGKPINSNTLINIYCRVQGHKAFEVVHEPIILLLENGK